MSRIDRRSFIKTGVATAAATTQAIKGADQKRQFQAASEAGRGIKIACSTSLWRQQGGALDGTLAGISRAGYEWVEVDSDQIWPYRDEPDRLKQMLGQYGLGLATASVSGNFADRDERLKNISRAVLTARLLQALGAGVLVLEGTGWGNIAREPRNYHVYSTNLSELGALVYEETGLHSAYRFHEQEAADVRKLIATSDSRYTKFCFDTQYLTQLGVEPEPMIRTYGARVLHIDLRDGKNKGRGWEDVAVGKGDIKIPPIMDSLCEARYNGWVSVHQSNVSGSPEKTAADSLRKVQAHLKTAEEKQTARDRNNPELKTQMAGMNHDHDQPASGRGSALLGLVAIGAAARQPFNMFMPQEQERTDKSNPMQATTDAMHAPHHHERVVTPLPPLDPYFQPLFFNGDEYRDVSALVEAIIPTTQSPGAREARADEYADLMIWLEQEQHAATHQHCDRFRQVVMTRYEKPFAALTADQQNDCLSYLTGKSLAADDRPAAQFFNQIRGLTIHAYYASPQGLIMDLGYKGNTYVAEFQGCTHPEHQA